MYVSEHKWDLFFYYLHAMSEAKLSGVFPFRISDGRITRSTLKDAREFLYRNGIRPKDIELSINGEGKNGAGV